MIGAESILAHMEPPSDDVDSMEWHGDPSAGVEPVPAVAVAPAEAISVIDQACDVGGATVKKQQQQQQQTQAAAAAAAATAAAATAVSPKISDQPGGKRGQFFSRANAADHARRTSAAEGGGGGGGRGRPPEKEGMEGGFGGEGGARSSKPKCGANNSNNSNSKAGGSGHSGAEYLCNECGLGFGSVPELQLHMARKTAWSNQGLVGCRVSCLVDNREWHEGLVTQVCLCYYFYFALLFQHFSQNVPGTRYLAHIRKCTGRLA